MSKQKMLSKTAKVFCLLLVFVMLLGVMTLSASARGGNSYRTDFTYSGSCGDGVFSNAREKMEDSATYVGNMSDCPLDMGVFGCSSGSDYGRECTTIRAYVYPDDQGYIPNTVYPTYPYARICCWADDNNYHSIHVSWSPDSEFYWG